VDDEIAGIGMAGDDGCLGRLQHRGTIEQADVEWFATQLFKYRR